LGGLWRKAGIDKQAEQRDSGEKKCEKGVDRSV